MYVFLVPVDRTLNVVIRVIQLFVHAFKTTLDVLRIVVPNVPAIPNAHPTWLASMKDVKIHARVVVVIMLVVV